MVGLVCLLKLDLKKSIRLLGCGLTYSNRLLRFWSKDNLHRQCQKTLLGGVIKEAQFKDPFHSEDPFQAKIPSKFSADNVVL